MIGIVGAGAAGLATAILAARRGASGPIVAFDGAARLGAKILVSGGARCNVTNRVVTERDFAGGSASAVRGILRAFPADETVAFFREIGVALHEEAGGKLFPDSNRARTVLDALLAEARRCGIELRAGQRVHRVARDGEGFRLETCDGVGYGMAVALGHRLVPQTPALVPLVLEGDFHAELAGVSHEAELVVRVEGERRVVRRGSLLWTHFGVSGPVVLDVSRFWHRAVEEGRDARISVSLLPGRSFGEIEAALLAQAAANPHGQVNGALGAWLPASVAAAVPGRLGVSGDTRLGQLTREDRRRLIRGLLDWPLSVKGSRGYDYAEVTAGGVPLAEIEPGTMASRRCPGLYLVGEILDVDGRIGGFNFQWAWSTAWIAAGALARGTACAAEDEAGVVGSRPGEG